MTSRTTRSPRAARRRARSRPEPLRRPRRRTRRHERAPRRSARHGETSVAALLEQDDADRMVDLVALRTAPRSELERDDSHRQRTHAGDHPVPGRLDRAARVRSRADLGRIATLRLDPAAVRVLGGAVGDRRLTRSRAPVVEAEVGQRDEPRRGGEHELGEVGRSLAANRRDRLADLERVADRAAERLVHVGQQADDLRVRRDGPSSRMASASSRRLGRVFMNAPSPTLTSSTMPGAPPGDLLRHDRHAISGIESTVAVTSRSA